MKCCRTEKRSDLIMISNSFIRDKQLPFKAREVTSAVPVVKKEPITPSGRDPPDTDFPESVFPDPDFPTQRNT